jgi:hypothetical protein
MKPISTDFLAKQTEGFIFSFKDLALLVPEEAGNLYRTAHGRSLTGHFTDKVKGAELTKLRTFAQPAILGTVSNISAGPDITASGIVIKASGSFEMAIPKVFSQFAPCAEHVGKDLLGIYGSEGFENATIQLVVQRTDMKPGEAHRLPFANWPDHMDNVRTADIDLLYAFSDVMPTEFQSGRSKKATRERSLTRFGAEIKHLSPTNPTDSPLRRTWGGFVITPFESPRIYTDNLLEDAQGNLRDEFKDNAKKFLETKRDRFFAPQEPEPIFA